MELSMQENASRCKVALGSLVAAVNISTSPATSLVSTRDLENLQERFSQWAGNLGALQPPESHLSLDHRLRNNPQIHHAIDGMLQDLYDSAQSAKDIIDGVRENRIDEPVFCSDADLAEFDISSNESDSSVSLEPELGQVSEIEQLMLVIKLSLDNLFKASIFIRKFSPKDQRRERARATNPFDKQVDVMYIKDRYPRLAGSASSEHPLAIRLGEANSRRRQYFKYCRDHNERLSNPVATKQVANPADSLGQPPRPQDPGWVAKSSIGSKQTRETLMADTEATGMVANDLQTMDLADDPPKSVVSFATSVMEPGDDELPYPPLPPEARASSSILCSYCWKVVSFQDGNKDRQWKKHVLGDLAPYVCTFPECNLDLFDSQHIWFEHELQMHRSKWVCPICSSAFESPPDLRSHIRTQHGNKISENQIAMVLEQSKRPVDSVDPSQCPLCDEEWASAETLDTSPNQRLAVSLDQFRKHLGHHLEQVALFSLPRLITTQGSKVNRLSSTLDRGRLQPDTDQWANDHGRGWRIILSRGATFIAMSYFISLYENLELHTAVRTARRAISDTPASNRPLLGFNYLTLSVRLQKRYQQTQELKDLHEALYLGEMAASSSSTQDTMGNLHNISILLYQQFEQSGSIDDLDKSIRAASRAATSAGLPDNVAIYKLGLIRSLTRRFDVADNTTDLEDAVKLISTIRKVSLSDVDRHQATRPRADSPPAKLLGRTQWIDDLRRKLNNLMQETASNHLSWQRISLEIGSYLEHVEIPELELELHFNDPTSNDSTSDMVIDTFPQYRLLKSTLLRYLRDLFPGYDNIMVEERNTEYRFLIPRKLTPAQRKYILKYICYRPESDDDY